MYVVLNGNIDMKRQLRSLYARSNALKLKFIKCFQLTVFKTYCTSTYFLPLLSDYSKAIINQLRVIYKNIAIYWAIRSVIVSV
jgi:hypothetical protein